MTEQLMNLLKSFNENKVRYLVIGGFAVNIYGYVRNTLDLDILLDDTPENRKLFRKSLAEVGIGDFEALETLPFIAGFTDINLENGMRLDIMSKIRGLENDLFEEMLDDATIVDMGITTIPFIDYTRLILAKKAANRPKDILDIEELEKIMNCNHH